MPIDETIPVKVTEGSYFRITDTRSSAPSVTAVVSTISLGNDRRTGTTVPEWRDRVAKGVDASSAYRRAVFTYGKGAQLKYAASTLSSRMPGYRVDYDGHWVIFGQPQVDRTTDAETLNRALAKFKNQLRSRTSAYRSMAPIAECRELAGLVRQASGLTLQFLESVLYARKTRGKSVWRLLTSNWLAFNFGLAPLIGDIEGVGKAIADYIARQDLSGRLSATATKDGMFSYAPSTSASPPGIATLEASGACSYKLSYRYVGGFELQLRSANNWSAFDQLGLGWVDIPAAAWELTAFSWLFDYFSNVGQFLEDAFTSPPGRTSYLVLDRRFEASYLHSFKLRTIPNQGFTELVNEGGQTEVKYFDFERTPLSSLPHIGLYVKSIDQSGKYGISKLLNLISLIRV